MDCLDGEFIDRVEQIEHLDALVAQRLHLRQLLDGLLVLGRRVVDLLLALRHAVDVFLERDELAVLRAQEQDEVLELVDRVRTAVDAVVDADLQRLAVLVPELLVPLAVVLELARQRLEDVLLERTADGLELAALLQELTRDVQREVRRVDETFHEAQVVRQQVLALVHDKDMAAVELQARLVIRLVEIERCMRRDGQECRILDRAFGLRVEDLHRVLPLVELMLEELVVLFFLDIRLVLRPERLHGVQRARLDLFDLIGALDLLAFLVLRRLLESEVHLDWVADVVAVLLDEALELIIVREVLLCLLAAELLLEVQRDGRAALIELALLNRVGAVGCGLPLPGLLLACLARHDRHVVGHHEGRVEADTELADHLFVG